jgi:hypothetical protein
MSTQERCANCGAYDDPANMELIFQEGSTYPDYWQHKYDCTDEDDLYDEDAPEAQWEREQMGAGWR